MLSAKSGRSCSNFTVECDDGDWKAFKQTANDVDTRRSTTRGTDQTLGEGRCGHRQPVTVARDSDKREMR